MNQVRLDHPIAAALIDNERAEQFYGAERDRVEREYFRAEDPKLGRRRRKSAARIEERLARKQQEQHVKKVGRA
ncbi:hypothetical protein QZN01_20735 [Burkholderia cenocepacia]|uniref:hypothetical protein n=1 Tax=Burkholderia cenocepacia TaxID=95486 RepID=UPI0026506C31|nr:hypothetical protein [Burkholderia cenocepacia]MDN7825082.1 hypothetical protein [Burkholderia cenocepacia]